MQVKIGTFILLLVVLLSGACGSSGASNQSSSPTISPSTNSTSPTEIPAPSNSSSTTVTVPAACALLTTADVEKITGYGNGKADSAVMGENETACTLVAGRM